MKIDEYRQYLNDRFAGNYRLHLLAYDGGLICAYCADEERENIEDAIETGTANGWRPIGIMPDSWLEDGEQCDLCNHKLNTYSDAPGQ